MAPEAVIQINQGLRTILFQAIIGIYAAHDALAWRCAQRDAARCRRARRRENNASWRRNVVETLLLHFRLRALLISSAHALSWTRREGLSGVTNARQPALHSSAVWRRDGF